MHTRALRASERARACGRSALFALCAREIPTYTFCPSLLFPQFRDLALGSRCAGHKSRFVSLGRPRSYRPAGGGCAHSSHPVESAVIITAHDSERVPHFGSLMVRSRGPQSHHADGMRLPVHCSDQAVHIVPSTSFRNSIKPSFRNSIRFHLAAPPSIFGRNRNSRSPKFGSFKFIFRQSHARIAIKTMRKANAKSRSLKAQHGDLLGFSALERRGAGRCGGGSENIAKMGVRRRSSRRGAQEGAPLAARLPPARRRRSRGWRSAQVGAVRLGRAVRVVVRAPFRSLSNLHSPTQAEALDRTLPP